MDSTEQALDPVAPVITFLLVVRNEREHVRTCLDSMLAQSIPRGAYEIIVVDGMSTDGTRNAVEDVIREHPARAICLLENPQKILSTGWNIGIRNARGEYVIRPDAHAEVPPDFLQRSLESALAHPEAWAVGGVMQTVGRGFWGRMIAHALSCRVGVGGSRFRVGGQPGPAETVVFALYRRQRLLEVGGLDETIPLNQDNVLHGKIRQRGGILYFDPSIRSTYFCRSTLGGLWRQMFRRALWLMLMLKHQAAHSLQVRHVIPLAFVLGLSGCGIVGLFWWAGAALAAAGLGGYFLAAWASGASSGLRGRQVLLLPLVFLTMHLSYGLGSVVGLVCLPFYRPGSGAGRG